MLLRCKRRYKYTSFAIQFELVSMLYCKEAKRYNSVESYSVREHHTHSDLCFSTPLQVPGFQLLSFRAVANVNVFKQWVYLNIFCQAKYWCAQGFQTCSNSPRISRLNFLVYCTRLSCLSKRLIIPFSISALHFSKLAILLRNIMALVYVKPSNMECKCDTARKQSLVKCT